MAVDGERERAEGKCRVLLGGKIGREIRTKV